MGSRAKEAGSTDYTACWINEGWAAFRSECFSGKHKKTGKTERVE